MTWKGQIAKFGKLNVGIQTQSVGVAVVSVLWYASVCLVIFAGDKGIITNLSLFWNAILFLGPFVSAILAAILVIACFRSGYRDSGWVLGAVAPVIIQWFFIIGVLFFF